MVGEKLWRPGDIFRVDFIIAGDKVFITADFPFNIYIIKSESIIPCLKESVFVYSL